MIPKPKYTTYNICIRDESEDLRVLQQRILNGLTIRISIPDTTEKYRIPHEIASHIEAELQTYILTEEERQQAKQEEETAYNKGLTDAWEAARKIALCEEEGGLSIEAVKKIFGLPFFEGILKDFDASEAIAKIKAYEDKQDEIKVGDEVRKKDRKDHKFIVTAIYEESLGIESFYCMNEYGVYYEFIDPNEIEKTGRHFPQFKELLKAMKEE